MSWWSRFCVSATQGWWIRMHGAAMNWQELSEQRGQWEAAQLRVEGKPLCRWTAVPPSHLSGSPENTSAFFLLNTLVLIMITIMTFIWRHISSTRVSTFSISSIRKSWKVMCILFTEYLSINDDNNNGHFYSNRSLWQGWAHCALQDQKYIHETSKIINCVLLNLLCVWISKIIHNYNTVFLAPPPPQHARTHTLHTGGMWEGGRGNNKEDLISQHLPHKVEAQCALYHNINDTHIIMCSHKPQIYGVVVNKALNWHDLFTEIKGGGGKGGSGH